MIGNFYKVKFSKAKAKFI